MKNNKIMEREFPTINILGTEYIIDSNTFELREKGNENNILYGEDFYQHDNGYGFYFDKERKNWPMYEFQFQKFDYVEIPEFVKMDPEGMSLKYGVPLDKVTTMSDLKLMSDPDAYDLRLKGLLPRVYIEGVTFYVDLMMNMLRPKDDFASKGISFSEIEDYVEEGRSSYLIPYNPKTHEFQIPDYDNLKEYPKDLIAVKFPMEFDLDRIGWNRKNRFDIDDRVDKDCMRIEFRARKVPWENTFMKNVIEHNLKEEQQLKEKASIDQPKNQNNKGKGIKM